MLTLSLDFYRKQLEKQKNSVMHAHSALHFAKQFPSTGVIDEGLMIVLVLLAFLQLIIFFDSLTSLDRQNL